MSCNRLTFIPMAVGPSPEEFYTKTEIDQIISRVEGEIPVNLSDLENDEGFITVDVNSLVNYYLKSETYTQTEVNNLIGSIEHFHYQIVATLPTTGESNILYLLGPIGQGADKYEEYVYTNNTWTKIGDTSIDLSNYYTKTEVDTLIDNIEGEIPTSVSELTNDSGYQTAADVQTAISGKQDTLTAGENITIENNVISATGGGSGNQWFGTQIEFDNLETYDADTDYFISDRISYSEIKGTPDLNVYATKTEVKVVEEEAKSGIKEVDQKAGAKADPHLYMTQEEFASITPLEGKTYAIEGTTVELTFTFEDDTTETHNFVID